MCLHLYLWVLRWHHLQDLDHAASEFMAKFIIELVRFILMTVREVDMDRCTYRMDLRQLRKDQY